MTSTAAKRRTPTGSEAAIAILVAFGMAFMQNDIVVVELLPLRHLGIAYPAMINFAPLFGPVLGLFVWFCARRHSGSLAAVLYILVMVLPLPAVVSWIHQQTESVPVAKWIDDPSRMEARLGFKVAEQRDSRGTKLYIEKISGHRDMLRAELHREDFRTSTEGK
ncbi:hypothetical protein BH10PLA1_BH10PLA1_14770 [soil metagenome]